MVVLKENSCRICSKVFCCSDCRDAHENNKHPKPKCSLCVKQALPFKSLENINTQKRSSLIDHVVFNHLPLHCKLCGDKYNSYQDLVKAVPCKWWTKLSKGHSLKPLDAPSQRSLDIVSCPTGADPSNVVIDSSELELTNPVDKKYPSTPGITNKSFADTSAISRVKQDPSNFDSPPELTRQTSTPVHGLGLTKHHQKQVNTAAIPQFELKTPSSSFDKRTPTFDGTGGSAISRVGSTLSTGFESRYYTGLTSGIICGQVEGVSPTVDKNDNICENQSEADPSWSTPSYPILKKDDKKDQIDKSIVSRDVLERISRINESSRDTTEKRVRFSDQCLVPSSTVNQSKMQEATAADNSAYFADNDIFFEARESLDEDNNEVRNEKTEESKKEVEERNDRVEKTQPEECSCCCRNMKVKKERNDSPISSTVNCNNNNNNEINEDKKVQGPADSSVGESKVNTSTSSTSSRVLMMLLVEQSDSKGLSTLDLAPLIDSGLKKLEETVANNSSNAGKGSHECSAEVLSFTRRRSLTEESTEKGFSHNGCIRTSIKDSYVSISDRVECYNATAEMKQTQETVNKELDQQLTNKADSLVGDGAVEPYKSDGIFSVMARVVRSALKKLPAVGSATSRNLSREPGPMSSPSTIFTSASTSSPSTGSTSGTSPLLSFSSSSGMLTVAPQCVLRSASKRPRDRLDSGEDQPQSSSQRDSPGSSSRNEVISSPVAKRPRGWYRIRGREPIARMRERQMPVSPRGASLETQRFHQGSGSLTIANSDTFLPLPSRAHQSTQTDERTSY